MRQKGFAPILIIFLLAIVGIVGAYYVGTKETPRIPTATKTSLTDASPPTTQIPSPIATYTPTQAAGTIKPTTHPTSNWKTYSNKNLGIEFKYPENYTVTERVPGFIVITLLDEHVPQGGISIEARLHEPYDSLSNAEAYIKDSLVLSQTTKLDKWQVYQGIGKEGMIKGIEFRQAIIPYKTGVIKVETIATTSYTAIFDNILSTFKFTQ